MIFLNQSPIHESFGKEQLEFLARIEQYENKNELSRFLLITSFGGLLSIIGGILELFFYKFYNIDVLFFQYHFFQNPDPALLVAVWILTIFPLLIIIIFTSGTSGIVNWNKTYRIIGFLAIILFFCSELVIVGLGEENTKLIPIIWGMFIFIGFNLASFLMLKLEHQLKLAKVLFLLGFLVLLDSILTYFFVQTNLAMFVLLTGFGIMMTIMALIFNLLESKFSILETNKH